MQQCKYPLGYTGFIGSIFRILLRIQFQLQIQCQIWSIIISICKVQCSQNCQHFIVFSFGLNIFYVTFIKYTVCVLNFAFAALLAHYHLEKPTVTIQQCQNYKKKYNTCCMKSTLHNRSRKHRMHIGCDAKWSQSNNTRCLLFMFTSLPFSNSHLF